MPIVFHCLPSHTVVTETLPNSRGLENTIEILGFSPKSWELRNIEIVWPATFMEGG